MLSLDKIIHKSIPAASVFAVSVPLYHIQLEGLLQWHVQGPMGGVGRFCVVSISPTDMEGEPLLFGILFRIEQ